MAYIKKLDNFVNEVWHGKEYFDFTALEDANPSERRRGCTYLLSDEMDFGGKDGNWGKVAVYVRNTDEEKRLKELCYGRGIMRFNGGEQIYDFGKCEVDGYGETMTLSEFERMLDRIESKRPDRVPRSYDRIRRGMTESQVNEALRRGNSDDYRFYVVSQNEADKLAGEYGSVEAIPNDVFIREAEAEGTVYSIDGFADAYNNMDLPTVGYSVLRILPKIVYSKVSESRSSRGGRTLNESKLLDTIKKYDSRKLDSIEALVHNEYSLTLDGLVALYRHFYRTDIDFFTEFLEYTGDRGNDWLKDEYEWWDFIKTYVAYKLLDDISVKEIVQAVIDEEYVNYMSDSDDIFDEFNRNETGKWAEGICAELGIQAPEMED